MGPDVVCVFVFIYPMKVKEVCKWSVCICTGSGELFF